VRGDDVVSMDAPDLSAGLRPAGLAGLQSERAAARKWLDACELDVLVAQRRLDERLAERASAQAALDLASENCERATRLAHHPVSAEGGGLRGGA
jgi:hypothetical protein